MKSKIRVIFVFFILSILMNPFQVFADQDASTSVEKNTDTTTIFPKVSPFYDAKILDGTWSNGKIGEGKILIALKTLYKYSKDETLKEKVNQQTELSKEFVDLLKGKLDEFNNPFLETYIKALKKAIQEYVVSLEEEAGGEEDLYLQAKTTAAEMAPSAAKKGLLSPTMFVDAMSKFIAKRFKEELATTFLERLRDRLNDKKLGLGLLFPSTRAFLGSFEIYDFKVFLPNLKTAFREDLNNYDLNLIAYLEKKKEELEESPEQPTPPPYPQPAPAAGIFVDGGGAGPVLITDNDDSGPGSAANSDESGESAIEKKRKLLNFAIFSLNLVHSIREGENPVVIITKLNESDYLKDIEGKYANPIRLLALITRNVENKEGDGFLEPAEFKVFLKTSSNNLRELFIGLIYAREIDEMKKIEFGDKKLIDILKESAPKFSEINGFIYKITVKIQEIEAQVKLLKGKEKVGFEEYNAYLDIVYDLVELGFDIKEFAGYGRNDEVVITYLGYARDLLQIAKNINDKMYDIAFVNTLAFLEKIFGAGKIPADFVKYVNFAINMINAENADEMEKILEATAMPVGGYRMIRSSPFSVSLTTYPGVFGSRETLTTSEQIVGEKDEWNVSFAAPIGLAFGLGRGSFDKPGPSWTFFFPVIDIGAAVSWRLGGEDKGIPDISWKNIFAPGAFIIYGVKNSPFSIGAGVQYGPQLREIKGPDEAVIESSAFRVGVLIAVEIPILNFYAKGK